MARVRKPTAASQNIAKSSGLSIDKVRSTKTKKSFCQQSNKTWPLEKFHKFLLTLKSLNPRQQAAILPFLSKTGIACIFDCAHNIRLRAGKGGGRIRQWAQLCYETLYFLDNLVTPFEERRSFLEGKKGSKYVRPLLAFGTPLMSKSLKEQKNSKKSKK